MDYSFGAARKLYEAHAHPRVLLGTNDLPRLRRILRAGDGKTIITAVRERALEDVRGVLEQSSPKDLAQALGSPEGRLRHVAGSAGGVTAMALVAVLDEDADALEAVRRLLAATPGAGSALAYDLVQPALAREERISFCRSVYARGVKETLDGLLPQYYHCAAGNIPMTHFLWALTALLCIDGEEGLPDMSGEWKRALSMLEATLFVVVGPEGYPEEDMGYGTLMFGRVAQAAELVRRAGLYDVYARCPRYAKFGNAMLHVMQPWGTHLTTTGDHGDDFGGRTFALARIAQETRNPALLWLLKSLSYGGDIALGEGAQVDGTVYSVLMADQFRKAAPPAGSPHGATMQKRSFCQAARRAAALNPPTSFCDPQRGMVSFRSGWDADATYVAFDGSQRSPAGQGHQHASCGHFMLSALGDYFAIGPGRYNMEQNCHNVVLIDGHSGRSTDGGWGMMTHDGVLTGYQPSEFVDAASVDSSLQHNCFWARRHLALVKGAGAHAYVWIVDDINKNNDWGEYWWQLHASPENTIRLFKSHATVTGWRSGNRLDVHFALPDPAEYTPPHDLLGLSQGEAYHSSHKYMGSFHADARRFKRPSDQVHYSAFVRPRLLAKIAGLNGRFMSVLLPRTKREKPAAVTRLKSLPGSLAVRISFEDVEDIVIFAHEHHLLEAADVRARGQWCVVRRRRADGAVLEHAVGEGTELSVAGRALPVQPVRRGGRGRRREARK